MKNVKLGVLAILIAGGMFAMDKEAEAVRKLLDPGNLYAQGPYSICWSYVAKAVMQFHGDYIWICDIISEEKFGNATHCCPKHDGSRWHRDSDGTGPDQNGECNKGDWMFEAVREFGYTSTRTTSSTQKSKSFLMTEINSTRPYGVDVYSTSGSGHALGIFGYLQNMEVVRVYNPWYTSFRDINFSTLENGYPYSGWCWKYTEHNIHD